MEGRGRASRRQDDGRHPRRRPQAGPDGTSGGTYRTATEVRDGAEVIGELEVFREAQQEIEFK